MAYVRFITDWTTFDGHQKCGLFTAACDVRDQFLIEGADFYHLCERVDWFTENMDIPPMLGDPLLGKTESWFHESAHEHIARAHLIALLLDIINIKTTIYKTTILDNLIYQDEHQVLVGFII